MTKLQKKHLLYWSIEILIILAIIAMCFHLSFLFSPILMFISTVFTPLLIAGILFYLLNPIKRLLMKVHITIKHKKHYMNRTGATAIIFLAIFILIGMTCFIFVPDIIRQITNLIQNMPELTRHTEHAVNHFSHQGLLKRLPTKEYIHRLQGYATASAKVLLTHLVGGVSQFISMATNMIIELLSILVILFFMLKDGYKFKDSISRFLPKKTRKPSLILLSKMSKTISKYIDGQLIECCFVGGFTMIGFLIIHQPYAILLGMLGGFCVIIPYIGAFIGIAPALLIGFTVSIWQVIWVIIVVVIVEQIDGNLIYPNVIGKSLQIHPLTIVIILLAVGKIMGILGMILAIPVYAILKTVVIYLHHIYILKYKPLHHKHKSISSNPDL